MASRQKPKGAAETPSNSSTVPMAPPKHGRGLLRQGNPGNSGGGRRPDRILRMAEQMTEDQVLPTLKAIIAGKEGEQATSEVISACKAVLGMLPKTVKVVIDGDRWPEAAMAIDVVLKAMGLEGRSSEFWRRLEAELATKG